MITCRSYTIIDVRFSYISMYPGCSRDWSTLSVIWPSLFILLTVFVTLTLQIIFDTYFFCITLFLLDLHPPDIYPILIFLEKVFLTSPYRRDSSTIDSTLFSLLFKEDPLPLRSIFLMVRVSDTTHLLNPITYIPFPRCPYQVTFNPFRSMLYWKFFFRSPGLELGSISED